MHLEAGRPGVDPDRRLSKFARAIVLDLVTERVRPTNGHPQRCHSNAAGGNGQRARDGGAHEHGDRGRETRAPGTIDW